MSNTVYLQELPDRLANYYNGTQRFYLEPEQMKHLEHSFLVYASALINREKLLPYEALIQAAARQNIQETIRLFHENQVGEFTGLVHALRLLLKPKALAQAEEDPVVQLIKANHEHLALARLFPKQADDLMRLAFIHDLPMDWEQALALDSAAGIPYLALRKHGVDTRKNIAALYARNKQFKSLMTWLIIDTEAALITAKEQATADDYLNLLALHGDLNLLSEHAYLFLSVKDDLVRDGLMLLFGEVPESRCVNNVDDNQPEWFFEPTQVKRLCKRVPRKLPSMNHGVSGEFFQLREKFYASH